MILRTRQQLSDIARNYGIGYRHAQPFPYVVFQGLFPNEALLKITEEVDQQRNVGDVWIKKQRATGIESCTREIELFGSEAQMLFAYLQSDNFCQFLEELTGIPNLNPDPKLSDGGIHMVEQGGFLDIHADSNYHHTLKQYRRVNLFLNLNESWSESFGGDLELWDQKMENCVVSISPLLNSCVILSTSDRSFHGQPDPLRCPDGMASKAIAVSYYTREKPQDSSGEIHDAIYCKRPAQRRTAG